MKKAIIYARVSTDDQAEHGYSLPSQVEACRKYAAQMNFEVVAEFREEYSGATPIEMRPEGRKAHAMLKRDEADAIIAYRIDRFVRPPEEGDEWDMPVLIRGLAKLGKELHTVNKGKLSTSFGDLLLALLDAKKAGEERRDIVERSNRGKRTKAQSGLVTGGAVAPYGYKHVRDAKGQIVTFEIVEQEAHFIRMMFDWYIRSGYSAQKIASELSILRVRTPGETRGRYLRKRESGLWSSGQVLQIIGHEVYAGRWHYNQRDSKARRYRDPSEHIIIIVPAIVESDAWERAQLLRQRHKEWSPRNRKREYLLSGMVKCTCGMSRVAQTIIGYPYYMCSWRLSHNVKIETRTCHARSVRGDELEAAVWAGVVDFFENLPELERLLRVAQAKEDAEQDPLREELATVEEFITECDREAADCAASIRRAKGRVLVQMELQQETINTRYSDLEKRRTLIRAKLAERTFTEETIRDTLVFAADVQAGLKSPDFATKRRNLETLNVKVTAGTAHFSVKCILGEWEGDLPKPKSRRPNSSATNPKPANVPETPAQPSHQNTGLPTTQSAVNPNTHNYS